MIPEKLRFPECSTCINKEFDPFVCKSCSNGSNMETEEDAVEELTMLELIDIMRESYE